VLRTAQDKPSYPIFSVRPPSRREKEAAMSPSSAKITCYRLQIGCDTAVGPDVRAHEDEVGVECAHEQESFRDQIQCCTPLVRVADAFDRP
jgi:hypothetical protein